MKETIKAFQVFPLFQGISTEGLSTMLDCFDAKLRPFTEGEAVVGQKGQCGILMDGVLENMEHGTPFPMPEGKPLFAKTSGILLLLDSHMLLYPCYGCCPFHAQLLENMKNCGIDFHALEG